MARWRETRERLLGLPLEIVPADRMRAEGTGAILAVRRMSLADGFPAALARPRNTDIHAGDPELRAAGRDARIVWLTH